MSIGSASITEYSTEVLDDRVRYVLPYRASRRPLVHGGALLLAGVLVACVACWSMSLPFRGEVDLGDRHPAMVFFSFAFALIPLLGLVPAFGIMLCGAAVATNRMRCVVEVRDGKIYSNEQFFRLTLPKQGHDVARFNRLRVRPLGVGRQGRSSEGGIEQLFDSGLFGIDAEASTGDDFLIAAGYPKELLVRLATELGALLDFEVTDADPSQRGLPDSTAARRVDKSSSQQASRGITFFAWGIILTLIGGFIVTGAVAGFFGVRGLIRSQASVHWPTVEGTVIESSVEGHRTQHAEILYEFSVGGTTFNGDRVSYGDSGSSNPSHARRIVNRYPAGKTVTVHYMPGNPQTCVLEPGVAAGAFLMPGFGLIFFVIGSGIGVALLKASRNTNSSFDEPDADSSQENSEKGDPQIRKTSIHRKRYWAWVTPLTGVAGIIFAILIYRSQALEDGHLAIDLSLIAAFVVLCLFGVVAQSRLSRTFRCPQCGEKIVMQPTDIPDPHREYRFHCRRCNVIWATDLYRGKRHAR